MRRFSRDGYSHQCKSCVRARYRRWLERNPGKIIEYRDNSNRRVKKKYAEDSEHREKVKRRVHQWKEENREKKRRVDRNCRLKREYGITQEEYEEMVQEQSGLCACCGKEKPLIVDHDHQTGAIRGLLCKICNVAIGNLGDSLQGLQRAVDYLRNHYERNSADGTP